MSPDKQDSPHSSPWHPCIAHGFSIGLTQTPSPSQTPAPGGPHDSPQLRPIHSSDPGELKTKERKLLIMNNDACMSYFEEMLYFHWNWCLKEYIPRGIGAFGSSWGRPFA